MRHRDPQPEPPPRAYAPLQRAPLSEERLKRLEVNDLIGYPELYWGLIVATDVVWGGLSYAFAVRGELTGGEFVELLATTKGRTEAFLLKSVILELANVIDREEALPTVTDGAQRRLFDDGRWIVADRGGGHDYIKAFEPEEYTIYEVQEGTVTAIGGDYSRLWEMAQALAKRNHEQRNEQDRRTKEYYKALGISL